MRNLAILCMLALSFVILHGCQSNSIDATAESVNRTSESTEAAAGAISDLPVATMVINGMACPQCSYNVDLQLMKVPGVERVKVNMGTGMVHAFLSSENPPSRDQLVQAIEQTTFTLVRIDMPKGGTSP